MTTWLIGTGYMSREYAKVLQEQKENFITIGNGKASADDFKEATGVSAYVGGISRYLEQNLGRVADAAIVAVPINILTQVTIMLLDAGVKQVLVEKPAGMDISEVIELDKQARAYNAAVYVAYNRRFYSATRKAKQVIEEDGGVTSFSFEFTEWSHEIEALPTHREIKNRWVLANSSHVMDLAFFLGGVPEKMETFHGGGLSWHSSASVFSGAGQTVTGALFSYQANWGAPGRWGAEFCTANHRFIFRPLEALSLMRQRSVAIEPVSLPDADIDKQFKPGLFHQTKQFLGAGKKESLCSISEHVQLMSYYTRIAQYV